MVLNSQGGRRYYPATATADGLLKAADFANLATDHTRITELWGRVVPSCRAYNSAAISIASATLTTLTFNSERYDSLAMHSTSVNTGRLTVPAGWGGVYRITAHVQFDAAAGGGRRQAGLMVNGTTQIAIAEVAPTAAVLPAFSVPADYTLAAGDYVEVIVYQDSGGALNVRLGSNYSPEFSAEWLHG